MPSSTGTRKFNRPACSDPVQIWLVSGVNLEATWSQHDPVLDPVLGGIPERNWPKARSAAVRRDPPVVESEAFFLTSTRTLHLSFGQLLGKKFLESKWLRVYIHQSIHPSIGPERPQSQGKPG